MLAVGHIAHPTTPLRRGWSSSHFVSKRKGARSKEARLLQATEASKKARAEAHLFTSPHQA